VLYSFLLCIESFLVTVTKFDSVVYAISMLLSLLFLYECFFTLCVVVSLITSTVLNKILISKPADFLVRSDILKH
jgi:hypothetical protein